MLLTQIQSGGLSARVPSLPALQMTWISNAVLLEDKVNSRSAVLMDSLPPKDSEFLLTWAGESVIERSHCLFHIREQKGFLCLSHFDFFFSFQSKRVKSGRVHIYEIIWKSYSYQHARPEGSTFSWQKALGQGWQCSGKDVVFHFPEFRYGPGFLHLGPVNI